MSENISIEVLLLSRRTSGYRGSCVLRDEGEHPGSAAFDSPLTEANELDVVVLSSHLASGRLLELGLVLGVVGDRTSRIHSPLFAECPEYGGFPRTTRMGSSLLISAAALASSAMYDPRRISDFLERLFERVREIDAESLPCFEVVGPVAALRFWQVVSCELETELQVRDGIWRHEQLESK